jgi:hypothetical protein
VGTSVITLAAVSGVSTFFYIVVGIAVVAGIGVILRTPWPIRGLGIGLLVGAAVIAAVILTGPTKH